MSDSVHILCCVELAMHVILIASRQYTATINFVSSSSRNNSSYFLCQFSTAVIGGRGLTSLKL